MMRIGQGFDIHAMLPREAEASSLLMRLGGVDIPSDFRLQGHSDADALLHAITDALLGASALGDIGRHFPDTDVAWKGADSGKLLVHCVQLVTEAGWRIENVDATVITQTPKIAPHAMAMAAAIAGLLAVDKNCVSVKAKTAENLGFVGRKEGLAVMAVALLSQ